MRTHQNKNEGRYKHPLPGPAKKRGLIASQLLGLISYNHSPVSLKPILSVDRNKFRLSVASRMRLSRKALSFKRKNTKIRLLKKVLFVQKSQF